VLQVNKAPVIDPLNNLTVTADQVENIIYLTGIGDGDQIDVQSFNVSLRPTTNKTLYKSIKLEYTPNSSTGLIRFTPSGLTGKSTVTLWISDFGGTDNGGVNLTPVSFDITFLPPTGLKDASMPGVKLYPNPTKGYVHLNVPEDTFTCYTVYNMIGSAVMNGSIGKVDNTLTIDINNLTSGLHLIKLTGSSKVFSLPFIVK